MASRILDMGDVMTLIEQAQKSFDAEQAEKMAGKLAAGEDFTLEDFLVQMQQLRQMGSMKKMLGMLPGMGQMREALDSFDEREVDRIEAIVRSMTPAERQAPKIINGSRRARIARGSGTTATDVNQLLERFVAAQKMMKQMAKGGGMPMPGMGNLPGFGGKKSKGRQQAQRKVKGRSGNPAQRAEQEREAAVRASEKPRPRPGRGVRPRRAAGRLGARASGSRQVPRALSRARRAVREVSSGPAHAGRSAPATRPSPRDPGPQPRRHQPGRPHQRRHPQREHDLGALALETVGDDPRGAVGVDEERHRERVDGGHLGAHEPGRDASSREPRARRSDTRSASSRLSWAALVAPYASAPGSPRKPATEATPTMWPLPAGDHPRAARRRAGR